MKTLEEKIAVMQWALENPEKELEFDNGQYILAKNAWWAWSSIDYNIPAKYQIAPGHNPAKLTVEQVGEGWRLLTKEEIEERARVMVMTTDIDCMQYNGKWYYDQCNQYAQGETGFYGNLLTETFRTQKPEGYFLHKEPQYRDWTIAEVPLGWWFKNKHSGVIETIERCYPDKTHPFTLSGVNESPAGLRKHWLCTSSNTPLAPDTVWSVCGVEV